MALIVHSPHSGKPVKVRPEDAGRALRDEQGKVFYVVEREDGSGYYGAKTRRGSAEQARAYDAMLAADAPPDQEPHAPAAPSGASPPDPRVAAMSAPAHDATGEGRPMPWLRGIVLIVLLGIIIALIVYSCHAMLGGGAGTGSNLRSPTVPGSTGTPAPKATQTQTSTHHLSLRRLPVPNPGPSPPPFRPGRVQPLSFHLFVPSRLSSRDCSWLAAA